MEKPIEQIIADTHFLFLEIAKGIKEVLDNCTDDELFVFNVESYALYSAVFGEVKIRAASHMLQATQYNMYEKNPWPRIEH